MKNETVEQKLSKTEQAFADLRAKSAMVNLEASIKEHYKSATRSVVLLRNDLLTAHRMLSNASCVGQFSAWLKVVGIPRATAYYILGKKNSKGEFADTGTGKWGAEPRKPLTAKQKKANRARRQDKASRAFNARLKATLVSKGPQGAREYLSQKFTQAFKGEVLIVGTSKATKVDNTPVGKWLRSINEMPADQAKALLKAMDNYIEENVELTGKKKPAASVRKESNVQPAATA